MKTKKTTQTQIYVSTMVTVALRCGMVINTQLRKTKHCVCVCVCFCVGSNYQQVAYGLIANLLIQYLKLMEVLTNNEQTRHPCWKSLTISLIMKIGIVILESLL